VQHAARGPNSKGGGRPQQVESCRWSVGPEMEKESVKCVIGRRSLLLEVPENGKRFMQPDNGAERQHDDLPPRKLTSANSAGH
jgi:hypothetical protein